MNFYDDELIEKARKNDVSGRISYKTSDGQEMSYQDTKMAPYGGSKWDSVQDGAVNKLLNMNYNNWTQGDQYKALADRYAQQGQLAMQNVLGQVADRTGGLASSYATTAAQQQYNTYMQDLETAAREMYGMERNELMDTANLARSLSQDDYGKYLDALSQHNTDRNFAYNSFLDSVGLATDAEKFGYQKEQDGIANDLNQDKFNHEVAQDNWNKNLVIAETRAAYGDFGGYKDLGFSDKQIKELEGIYKAQGEAAAMETAREWWYKIAQLEMSETGETSTLDDLKKSLVPAPEEPDYGASFNPIWTAAKTMFYETPDVSEADIVEFLDQFGEDRLTEAGLDYIMNNLFFGGHRDKEA